MGAPRRDSSRPAARTAPSRASRRPGRWRPMDRAALERDRQLRPGRQQDHVRLALARLPERVGAAEHALGGVRPRCGRRSAASDASARGQPARPLARARSATPSTVSFASPGRTYQRFGIARSAMWCSTGWCVGPSSPTPTESCVHTQTTGRCISGGQPDGGAHVVGEDEERRAERLAPFRGRARSR